MNQFPMLASSYLASYHRLVDINALEVTGVQVGVIQDLRRTNLNHSNTDMEILEVVAGLLFIDTQSKPRQTF